ncbi:MAG: hypothetical protein HY884_02085 [Deltaproteobacteria bacterium]|nr:hypothetical protein [Deltaproteobacteria bacterium]
MSFQRLIALICLSSSLVFAAAYPAIAEDASAQKRPEADNKRIRIEPELDAYYSSIGLYISLTDAPIPDAGEKPELQIYRDLLFSSLIPRFLVLEASAFPMPGAGVLIKDHASDFYDSTEVMKNLNLVKAVTAGFEEPYALTAFLGNVVAFTRPGEKKKDGNFGYMGYLVSAGNYTIKDNSLIRDHWTEVEWKIKGDRKFSTHSLHWSFRVGGKLHGNSFIKDVVYLSVRRSRLDFEDSPASFINNSGFEYTIDMDSQTFTPIKHYFVVDKKWPLKEEKMGFSFAVGFVWEGASKYSGDLADKDKRKKWQLLLRPNILF